MRASEEEIRHKLEAWSRGKSPVFAAHAILVASACETMASAMSLENWNAIRSDCVGRDDEAWRRYYRSPFAWLRDLLGIELADEPEVIALAPHAAIKISDEDRQIIRAMFAVMQADLEEIIDETVGGGPEPFSEEFHERGRQLPAMSFLVQVQTPCVVLHGRLAHQVFASATNKSQPDLDDIVRITSVDLEAIHLPEIREALKGHDLATTQQRYEIVTTAYHKPLKLPNRVEVKQQAACFISRFGRWLGEKATAPQIHDLFDIIAEAQNPALLVDPDFAHLQKDSFARMLLRNGDVWDEVLADKEWRETVRALSRNGA